MCCYGDCVSVPALGQQRSSGEQIVDALDVRSLTRDLLVHGKMVSERVRGSAGVRKADPESPLGTKALAVMAGSCRERG